jgi:hypothetical protein
VGDGRETADAIAAAEIAGGIAGVIVEGIVGGGIETAGVVTADGTVDGTAGVAVRHTGLIFLHD